MSFSRRDFVKSSLAGAVAAGTGSKALALQPKNGSAQQQHASGSHKRPIIVCAHNGYNYINDAYDFLKSGGDTLDAALRVVKGPEDDPNDTSVGLGGLPNEEGVVELDSCCMHGPTRRAGSVGGVRNIKNVSLVAKSVMTDTGHVMLAGEGAERFAVAMGYPRENLLTDHSRKIWLLWKEYHTNNDWWGPGLADPHWQAPPEQPEAKPQSELWQERYRRLEERAAELGIAPELRRDAIYKVVFPPTGTIHCSALNEKGEISGCTTTSGLAYKLPGRLGDSPIIGAGCYTDQDVGSAGATGSGEENIKVAGAHSIVENMRHGMSPEEAGMDTLKRIARNYNNDMSKLRYVDMVYYILRKDGTYAGVSLWTGYEAGKPHTIVVHDGERRAENTKSLFQGFSRDFPPEPNVPEEVRKRFQ
ncbi:MAG TPA: isoaspartyl peptidase/L-asparaginase [Candidatus Sulfotelmatobacter sp.]|nr:isoaspartyl peptidase/L-asparaginase [Candidatus Sulfotelmatobacter sp.]